MSGGPSTAMLPAGTADGSSRRKLTVDTDDVDGQQNADVDLNASLGEGCLKLGDNEPGEDNNNFELQSRQRSKYVTRYRIDHELQTTKLCNGVTMEECIPCCPRGDEDDEEKPVSCVWYLTGSEMMVFILHVSAIVFGVVKEALDMRHDASKEELHFAHSMVETAATFAVIVIQMLHTRMGYVKVRQAVERLEHFDPNEDAHLRSIKTWMWLAVAVGFVLISACVGCFLAFYTYVHLGWTVLSNQSCIVISLAVFGLYSSRVMAAVFRINMDQHKVVIWEALMLLKKRCRDTDAEGDDAASSNSSRAAALRFLESVSNTKSLSRPEYINVTCSSQQRRC